MLGFRSRVLVTALRGGLLAGLLTACSDVPAAFGPTPVAARTNADGLFGALTFRFTNVSRAPRYARARELLGRYALTPSTIYNDTSVWTAVGPDGTRTLFGDASFANEQYVFTNVPTNTPLDALADGRHVMRLHKLSDNEYEWFTGVDFAVGSVTADDMHRVISRWLATAEGHDGAELRQAARAAFPRTTVALGKLFTLDTIVSTRDAVGGNALYLGIRLTPDGVRATFPNYAAYLDKYIKRVKFRFTLLDTRGNRWFDAAAHDDYLTVRLRTKDGHFAPIDGPASVSTTIPDTLVMRMDMTAKISLFTVGFHQLTGEWVNVGTAHERGWATRFTKEPDWELPPAAGMLLRSPLRRPFQGDGTRFRFTFADAPGHQTIMTRRGTTTVQESAVLRFLGKLGGAAMGDFVAKAEEEENRFNLSVFAAMKGDIDAALR